MWGDGPDINLANLRKTYKVSQPMIASFLALQVVLANDETGTYRARYDPTKAIRTED